MKLNWQAFERIQRALDDNELVEIEEIMAFLRASRFQDIHFFLNLARIWRAAEDNKVLRNEILGNYFALFDGIIEHMKTLGSDIWGMILSRIRRALKIVLDLIG